MIPFSPHTHSIGRYLVSPQSQATENGFTASVAIRSGHGSGTHAKVYRFIPRFLTSDDALRYALAQGRQTLQALAA